MVKTATVEVRISDMPAFKSLLSSLAALFRALGKCDGLPPAVMTAADEVRQAIAGLGGRDAGPPPGCSDEDRIREAMTGATDYPGRVVTR